MTRRRRTTRAVYAVYVLVVGAFVASSITQVARHVFVEAPGEPTARPVGEACAALLSAEIRAIDEARLAASGEVDGEAARARFARERRARGAEPERACASDPQGTEALAALARFDRAAEAHALRDARELSPVRLAAQSFIRGPR